MSAMDEEVKSLTLFTSDTFENPLERSTDPLFALLRRSRHFNESNIVFPKHVDGILWLNTTFQLGLACKNDARSLMKVSKRSYEDYQTK